MVYAIQFIMSRLIENILIKIINNFKSAVILIFQGTRTESKYENITSTYISVK